MYRSILVPLDGSAFGEYALPYALSLARRCGAPLHLAHVHVWQGVLLADESDAQQRASESMYLEGLVRRIEANWNVPLTTMLLNGPVVRRLQEYAVEREADLLVMTTHGRGALSRFWLGSVADALIRQVSPPVLLVRPKEQPLDLVHEPPINHMLIPLDGSPLAEQVLPHATALGRLTEADYTLLQAIEPIFVVYTPGMPMAFADFQSPEGLQQYAQSYLDGVAHRLQAEGLRVKTVTALDRAAGAILDYARAQGMDMIALATHGHTGIARWVLGAVADKVIRGATVPVLLYRPQGGKERVQ